MNEETWTKYAQQILSKFPDFKKAIKDNRIQLPNRKLKKYIWDFPSDYGGLGEVLEERKFEKLNFFENKVSKNKQLPSIDLRNGLLCVPLESRNENINIIYNHPTNVNIFSSINPNISHEHPLTHTFPPTYNPSFPMPIYPYYRPAIDMKRYVQMRQSIELSGSTKAKSKDESDSESNKSKSRSKDRDRKKHQKEKSKFDIYSLSIYFENLYLKN